MFPEQICFSEQIEDVDAVKPDDWDESEPKEVVDENAVKPSDWNEEEVGRILVLMNIRCFLLRVLIRLNSDGIISRSTDITRATVT